MLHISAGSAILSIGLLYLMIMSKGFRIIVLTLGGLLLISFIIGIIVHA